MTSMQSDASVPGFLLKEFLGMELEMGDGKARAWLDLGPRHMNPNNVVHGSVTHALMDTAMGAAVMSQVDEGQFCATIEMHVRYLRGASEGRLTAEVQVINAGRRIVHLEAKTTDERGKLVATATSSFAVITP